MIAFRSILFNAAFYINLIGRMIIFTPYYFLAERKAAWSIPKNWVRSNHWLQKVIVGTTFEIEGLENIPEGGYIFAPKHQSFWDAYGLLPWLDDPVYILKRELGWIPLFGQYIFKMKMIPVDRGAKGKVMAKVLDRTRQAMQSGRQLIIYPEGTRRPPGAPPSYKYGIARLYRDLDVRWSPLSCIPACSGHGANFCAFPGHFKVRVLKPIPPGMDSDAFMQKLIDVMETESDALLIETVAANPHLPLREDARRRLEELGALPSGAKAG